MKSAVLAHAHPQCYAPSVGIHDLKCLGNFVNVVRMMEILKSKLKNVIEKNGQTQSVLNAKNDDAYFEEEYVRIKYPQGMKQTSMIPTFFKKSDATDRLQQKLREDARTQLLLHRTKSLLDNEDLKLLWTLLDTEASKPDNSSGGSDSEKMLNFEQYNVVAEKVDEKCKPYFTAKVFAKLQINDPQGRISVMVNLEYLQVDSA